MNAQEHYDAGQNCLDASENMHIAADHAEGKDKQEILADANLYAQRAQAHFLAASVVLAAHPAHRGYNYSPGAFT